MGRSASIESRTMAKKEDRSIRLFQLSLFGGRDYELLTLLNDQLAGHRPMGKKTLLVMTPNPEQVVLTRNNSAFLRDLQSADVLLPDGIGLIYASKILSRQNNGRSLPQRLPGRSVVAQLLQTCAQNQYRVLVVGGRNLGEQLVFNHLGESDLYQLRSICPSYSGGTRNDQHLSSEQWYWAEGYTTVAAPTVAQEQNLRALIEQVMPDLVFVAFGAPYQEQWLVQHQAFLEENKVKLAMGVGGAFDVLTGALSAPPAWMEKVGLEWAFRLWQQPRRWRRQLALFQFVSLVLAQAFVKSTR